VAEHDTGEGWGRLPRSAFVCDGGLLGTWVVPLLRAPVFLDYLWPPGLQPLILTVVGCLPFAGEARRGGLGWASMAA
jgi:hypothetical protein